ncbi:hypothetical protein [Aliarcobacter butzleri]|jgi:sulfate adenylyltransferase subunit 1 (EFTu-like GTPase family)|uniref:Uncharacterized protein n=1 Tax=Aliarcobacter butzleri TaxID=28197 RepID=A0AAW7QGP3_9BACT|nr:hypothetical protein [Aliarcobacter butzleri]MCG3684361.1 hypothetical protein [Aliarcobacter butzleri]MCG3686817.1 hypothetical protein [Aliarcobacter butzleri]MCG3711556.1 hypothetical protein [Aliarcobacter butzleri]MCG3714008.1 hypothetical protein [Aliarcobacter butzleri]MDN5108090.1 hypothetical protein [Aliarcobacter butzleri]
MEIQIIMFLLVTVIALVLYKLTKKEDEATKLARLKKLKEKEEINLYKSIKKNNRNNKYEYNQNVCCKNNFTDSVNIEQFETNPATGLYICGGVDSMGNSYGYDNH